MAGEEYHIAVMYNTARPEWREATEAVFRSLADRRLVFSASPSSATRDLNAVRVFINHNSVSRGYSPLGGQDRDLEEALDKLSSVEATSGRS